MLILAIALAAVIFYALFVSKSQNWPDGPTDLPFIGVLPDKKLLLHQQLFKFVPQFGDFFSFNLGSSKVVVLSSPTAQLIVKRGQNYSSRPSSSLQTAIIAQDRLVQMQYGDQFRKHRKVTHTLLGMQNAKTFLPYQEYESRQTLRLLLANPTGFYKEMQRYAASVTFSLLLGSRFARNDTHIPHEMGLTVAHMFEQMRPGSWLSDWIPLSDYLPDSLAPWRAKAQQLYEGLIQFWSVFYDPIAGRVENGEAPECFLKRFLESPEIGTFSESERRVLFSEILAAGFETTAMSLHYFFKAALLNPEFVKNAQEELDRVVGPDRLPGFEDRPNLPYIKALTQEVHRWSSVSPLSFYHATTDSDTYRGKTIPAKTTVIYNTYAVHYGEAYFRDPKKFIPERYLPEKDPRHMPNGAYAPVHYGFGAGRRECPGKHVADASLFIVLSRLLWAFDIELGSNPLPGDGTVGPINILGPAEFGAIVTPRSEKAKESISREGAFMDPALRVEDAFQYEDNMFEVLAKKKDVLRP
ncbi:cytochrome P450 [Cadophora sp. MPI-SDFR-AT-0126]|nr:cytochrome P450 [Leotiomycetes sp. MPI-SDFR-AT-0126]